MTVADTLDRPALAAVILAGGRASRLGGAPKPALVVDGVPMIRRVLAAVADASVTVIVGPPGLPVPAGVRVVREHPPGGGPVAALAAAIRPDSVPAALTVGERPDSAPPPQVTGGDWPPVTAVLGGDLPLLTATAVDLLRTAAAGHDGAVFVDVDGREQWLCGVWQSSALAGALRAVPDPANQPLRAVLAGLDVVRVRSRLEPPPWFDCDTEDDLRRAEEWLRR